jgi:alkylhydroperoxidase family enzyme
VMLRDNLDPQTTTVGLPLKHMAGLVYATVVGDDRLAAEVRQMAERSHVSPADLDLVAHFARLDTEAAPLPSGLDARAQAALLLARAASPSPAAIPAAVIEACSASKLPAAAVIEIISWLSVLQAVHRLSAFYRT